MTIDNLVEKEDGLKVIEKEGFKDTGQKFGYSLRIYKSQVKGLLYDPERDAVVIKYDLKVK